MDLIKPSKEHIVIFELDVGVELERTSEWVPYGEKIWAIQYWWDSNITVNCSYGVGSYGWGFYGGSGTINLPPARREKIFQLRSVIGGVEQLTETTSVTQLKTVDDAFYFDDEDQVLYIRTASGDSPSLEYEQIILGVTQGYSNISKYYNNLFYQSRILSAPVIKNTRDSLFYGLISFEGSKISLNNKDGYFDDFENQDINGAKVRILYGVDDADYSEFLQLYEGYVEDFNYNKNEFIINFIDERKNLQNTIVKSYFTSEDKSWDGKPIPLAYGSIVKAPAAPLQSTDGLSTYEFKFCDTILHSVTSIDEVYVNNKAVTPSSSSLAQGTFILDAADYEPGDDVTISFTGANITNGLNIMKDLLTNFTDLEYNSIFFNTTEWDAATTEVDAIDLGVYIQGDRIVDVIEKISSTLFGLFIIQGDGRVSYYLRDTDEAAVKTINKTEYIDSFIQIDRNSDEYLSSVEVRYNMQPEGDYEALIDTSEETPLYLKFRKKIKQVFDTVLTTSADAQNFATEALDTFGGVFPIYSFTTKMQNIDIKITDNINIDKNIRFTSAEDIVKAEVISTEYNLQNYVVNIKARKIGE